MASPGRDGCWVSWDRHTQTPGYGGPDAPERVSTPFLPPPLSLSAAANPIPGHAGWERVSVVLSLSFTPRQRGQGCLSPPCPHLSPNSPGSQGSPVACPSPLRHSPSQTPLRGWMWYQASSLCPISVTWQWQCCTQPRSHLCPVAVGGLGSCCWRPGCVSWLCVPACVPPPYPHSSPWGSAVGEQCRGPPCPTGAPPPPASWHLLQLPAHKPARRWCPCQGPAGLMALACSHPSVGERSSIPQVYPLNPLPRTCPPLGPG